VSLNTEYIPYGESSIGLVKHIPAGYGDITSLTCTIAIADMGGSALLAETSTGVAVYAGEATGAAITRGDTTVTLTGTPTAPIPGRVYRAQGTGETSEDCEVTAYNASTKVVSVLEPFEFGHASGGDFIGRWITYTLDASDTDDFALLGECAITWGGLWPAGQDIVDYLEVSKGPVQFGRLRQKMVASNYKRYVEAMPDGGWNEIEKVARAYWRLRFWQRDRNFEKLIVEEDLKDLLMMEAIARHIASTLAGGNRWDEELKIRDAECDRLFTLFNGRRYWVDTDEDRSRETDEHQMKTGPNFFRRGR
jgi:hypothetical protein